MEIRLKEVIQDGTYAPSENTFAGIDSRGRVVVFDITDNTPEIRKLLYQVKSIPGVNLSVFDRLHAVINVNSHNIEIIVYRDSDLADVVRFIYHISKLNVTLAKSGTKEYVVSFNNYSLEEYPTYVKISFSVTEEEHNA